MCRSCHGSNLRRRAAILRNGDLYKFNKFGTDMISSRWMQVMAGALFLAASPIPGTIRAELTVASPFRDQAVLQRDMTVPVWGTGDAGTTVTVHDATPPPARQCVPPLSAANAAAKPNIILIVDDDLGYRDLSCFGSPSVKKGEMERSFFM